MSNKPGYRRNEKFQNDGDGVYSGYQSRFSRINIDGIDGWEVRDNGYSRIQILVPSDYSTKKPISIDDITNLRIELETVKNLDDFYNSSVFFVQKHKAMNR